jgi:hypothetical protein
MYGKLTVNDIPEDNVKDTVTSRTQTHRHQERDSKDKPSRTIVSTERKTTRTYSLTARAVEFGKKIINDYRWVAGVLDNGTRNRKWVIAVCRWISRQQGTDTVRSKWIAELRLEKRMSPSKAKFNSRRL